MANLSPSGSGARAWAVAALLASAATAAAEGNPAEFWSRKAIEDVAADAQQAKRSAQDAQITAGEANRIAETARSRAQEADETAWKAQGTASAAEGRARQAEATSQLSVTAANEAASHAKEANDAALRAASLVAELEAKRLQASEQWLATFKAVSSSEVAAWEAIAAAAKHEGPVPAPQPPGRPGSAPQGDGAVELHAKSEVVTKQEGGELGVVAAQLGEIANKKAACKEQMKAADAEITLAQETENRWRERLRAPKISREERDKAAEKADQAKAAQGKWAARKEALGAVLADLERGEHDGNLRREYLRKMFDAGACLVSSFLYAGLVVLIFAGIAAIHALVKSRVIRPLPAKPEEQDASAPWPPSQWDRTFELVYAALPLALVYAIVYAVWAIVNDYTTTKASMNAAYAQEAAKWVAWWKANVNSGQAPALLSPEERLNELMASQTWKTIVAALPFGGIATLIQKIRGTGGKEGSGEKEVGAKQAQAT